MTTQLEAILAEREACAPTREQLDAYLVEHCGRGVPMFEKAETLEQAMHALAYIQRQILSTTSYKPHIGQTNAATSGLQWALDYFARTSLAKAVEAKSEITPRRQL